jgi:hypothetical protein
VVITQDRHDLFGFGCLGKVGKATLERYRLVPGNWRRAISATVLT